MNASSDDPPLCERGGIPAVRDAAAHEVARKGTTGIAVPLFSRDRSEEFVCGYSDLEAKHPVEPSTMYRIDSVTKPLTAAVIAALVGSQEIAYADSVRSSGGNVRVQRASAS
jgi:CubicO group peptidase (beta-lactamase class C family)